MNPRLNMSRAQRIVWLLEECKGCDYDIDVYKRGSDMLAPADLKKVHPLGKSPLVTIKCPEKPEGLVIAESGFMTEYLCDYFGQHLVPKRFAEGKEGTVGGESEQWLRYRFYMHYAEGSLMTMLLIALLFDRKFCLSGFGVSICVATDPSLSESEKIFFIEPFS